MISLKTKGTPILAKKRCCRERIWLSEAVLRSARFHVQNLGTALPVESLFHAIEDLCPTIFWLSVAHVDDPSRWERESTPDSSAHARVAQYIAKNRLKV